MDSDLLLPNFDDDDEDLLEAIFSASDEDILDFLFESKAKVAKKKNYK